MTNSKKAGVLSVIAVASLIFQATLVYGALTPSYFLAQINNNTQTQVTVIGADPNASVLLYYPLNGAYSSVSIGATDSTGHLTATVNPSTYSITSGGASYVLVDGAQSQTQTWPAYSSTQSNTTAGLVLSQNNAIVTVGQPTAISASVNSGSIGTLSVPTNTNPSVASAAISGTNIILNGTTPGATTLTICATTAGCSTLYVTVQQQASSGSTGTAIASNQPISFSPTSLTLKKGDSQTVALSGTGSYYLSVHSRPGTVDTSLNGSTLTLTATSIGSDDMGVCSSSSGSTSCATLSVTVIAADNTVSNSGGTATISFSPNSLNLTAGQTQTVAVTGSTPGSYYISSNSNTDSVAANLSGSTISVTGNKMGGSNITVCQFNGNCGSFYAYVPANGSSATVPGAAVAHALALSSFSVSSNNVNDKFLGSSVALTIAFSLNQSVTSPTVTVGGAGAQVFGSGSGPYTAIYTMNGSEASPLIVDVGFGTSPAGTGSVRFMIGTAASAPAASVPAAPSAAGAVFTSYLEVGDTGAEVTALQNKLTALGVYSGPVTGKFGAQTEAAVKKLQSQNGLTQLGAVGPGTRAVLNR